MATTKRQKSAVRFCVSVLYDVEFHGDINDAHSVSQFLSEYLDDAKMIAEEAYCEYQSYLWEKY